jgi:hypothetical protein
MIKKQKYIKKHLMKILVLLLIVFFQSQSAIAQTNIVGSDFNMNASSGGVADDASSNLKKSFDVIADTETLGLY